MYSRSIDSRKQTQRDHHEHQASAAPRTTAGRTEQAAVPSQQALLNAFLEDAAAGLLRWCDAYHQALVKLNERSGGHTLEIEEVYFRVAYAINRDLLGFLMSREVSMVQNSIGVVAAMTRARLFEAEPSLLSYLEYAHDMLRRLDPLLWREFSDVVRYVLPLRIRMLYVGVDDVPELGAILNKTRQDARLQDIYPLGHEQVGTVIAMLSQESSAALYAQVVKIVSPVITTPRIESRAMPLRFSMSRSMFESRLRSLTPIELLSILYGFKLYTATEQDVPRQDDKRMRINSLYFLLGEGTLFPLNKRVLVDISPQLIDMQKKQIKTPKVPQLPSVYFENVEQIFAMAQDGSLSGDNMSSSDGEDMSHVRPVRVDRTYGSSGARDYYQTMQQSSVSVRQSKYDDVPPSYASRQGRK